MRLKVTLARASGVSDDIVVTADAAATIAEVAEAIAVRDPRSGGVSSESVTLAALVPGQPEPVILPPDAAIGESWVGSGAMVALADRNSYFAPARAGAAAAVATLRVLSGPETGREFSLPAGTSILGRDASCDIVLNDPLVSKRHVRFECTDAVEVIDIGSANGVVVDGGLISRLRVESSERMLIGDTEVLLTVRQQASAKALPKAGPVPFNRSPKVEQRYAGRSYAAPEAPSEAEPQPFPVLALLAPVLMGAGLYFITQRVSSLLFVLLAPVLLIGNHFQTKSRDKKKLKRLLVRFTERLEALVGQLEHEKVREREVRLAEAPSTEEALSAAAARSAMMWTRRPEHWTFLNVRLGVGRMTSRNSIDDTGRADTLPELAAKLEEVSEAHRYVDGVPIVDNLFDSGSLGVAGNPATAGGSINSILVQLTALHSPAELVIAALVTPQWSSELAWLKWMPHTSSPQSPLPGVHLADGAASGVALLSALEELVATRLAASRSKPNRRGAYAQDDAALERGADVGTSSTVAGTKSAIPAVVVLISGDVGLDRARLVQLAETAADAGVFPIWIAPDVPSLPAACRTYLELDSDGETATVGFVRLGETITGVKTELVPSARALAYARFMAPVFDAGARVDDASDLPRSVSLITLLGHELVESSGAVIDRWRQNDSMHDRSGAAPVRRKRAGSLRATVGSSGVDPMHLDLRGQGPHALVGGTTGAGKSEFLQAWVLGMAAEYSPDRVTFLFVDYKGGSAFADCVTLPHCVGLVTDLSPHLVRRALTSLRAELHRREHLFNRKKVKDLLELEKRGDPESPPALVLVIDEFAALVGEVPEFVDGVVDIAQRGRSLGIHLIMATQRPAGVIKDNLRANTNLRVALRMADESDSNDVVGVQDAARFDPGLPGRGIAKTGPGRLSQFQSAYAGGWTSRDPERADVGISELRFGGEVPWEAPKTTVVDDSIDPGPTDQQQLVTSIIAATQQAELPQPRRPWLDEMPPMYDLAMLPQRTDAELMIGVSDIPQMQEQKPVYFVPDVDGHMVIYGTGGSGKSTALRSLAIAAAITPRGGPVEVYGLDFGAGSLKMLEALPHVGSIINGDDSERIVRLFRTLRGILEERGPRFAEANASSIRDYRALTGRHNEPRILLLIDGFPAFRNDWEVTAGRAVWFDVFKDLLSDGRQLGIHVAFTADRPGAVPSSVASSVQRRLILRLADESAYGMLDAPNDILSTKSVPGRAILDGMETQVAVFGGSQSASIQSAAVKRLASTMVKRGLGGVAAIGALPELVSLAEMPASVSGMPGLGIADETLAPVGFDPSGSFLLSGSPGSGRTNALLAVRGALVRFDPEVRCYFFGSPRSTLASEQGWAATALGVDQIAQVAKELSAAIADQDTEGRIAIFVESIADYLQTPADGPLVQLIKDAKRSEHFLLGDGDTSTWSSSWPLIAELKNARRGFLLQPDSMEGEIILKTPLARLNKAEFPPGRGMYIARGKSMRVQLPLIDLVQ